MTLTFFALFLLASAAAAATGIIFKPGDWYLGLNKPGFTPPNWVFPVAWTYLYVSVAYAAARVAGVEGSQIALALFAVQIALNTLWTPVFFGAHRLGMGMTVLACLWVAVVAMMMAFFRLDLIAGLLVIPYLAWLSLASALNFRVWRDNRS
ncbi:MAG: tryptophan-rich sensory protein [Rhodobacteraceae bacterium]|jgi:tryptophan-rich sensory protein|uniref:tryptophan-rich sensory protein TspO n=1 Tax=Thioclava sp. L04-15 TaxID=1915318 RepID=UPI0009970093|nr:TspO/MBR family protein [Thioclava sp. L04-15]OOY29728.1 sensory protein TspO [Thioclava sp. L04-15]TNE93111.1 MAG: tryptophan-rich sensory protein [Paracoccaceae bacterium]TNF10863.1 MAG: tryptophan-rich sensory protein [Paracoccaceae bacterium]